MSYFLLLILFVFSAFAEDIPSAAGSRLDQEESIRFQNFTLLAHKQNYLLPVTYNFKPNNRPYELMRSRGSDAGLDRVMRIETKFQLSFKFPIATNLFSNNDSLWAAYTQQSYWQVYNQNSSRPFRESNYEPEFFYLNRIDFRMGDFKFDAFAFGYIHQSNGQTELLSRNWDRIYVMMFFSLEHFVLSIKPWYRFTESTKDDNPDIEDYMGFFETRLVYRNANWTYMLMLRNVLKDDLKGYREFSVSFPLNRNLKGFFQYANGYGENLLDYNTSTNRFGLGLVIADYL